MSRLIEVVPLQNEIRENACLDWKVCLNWKLLMKFHKFLIVNKDGCDHKKYHRKLKDESLIPFSISRHNDFEILSFIASQ